VSSVDESLGLVVLVQSSARTRLLLQEGAWHDSRGSSGAWLSDPVGASSSACHSGSDAAVCWGAVARWSGVGWGGLPCAAHHRKPPHPRGAVAATPAQLPCFPPPHPHPAQVQRQRLQTAEGQSVCGTVVGVEMPVAAPGEQQAPDPQVWVDVDGRGRVSSSSWLLQSCGPQVRHLRSLVWQ
jgi:hypothetical protein